MLFIIFMAKNFMLVINKNKIKTYYYIATLKFLSSHRLSIFTIA